MVVAIDGPAGCGKSTIAKMLAKKLGYYYLNTGSFYRAFTLAQMERGLDTSDKDSVLATAKSVKLTVEDGNICLDGVNVEPKLHTPAIDAECSLVSIDPRLREYVNSLVKDIAGTMDIITEGRDTTTVIFPDADYKFYFDASPEVRARRRLQDQADTSNYEEILQGIIKRDENDKAKSFGALKIASGAIIIDTSNLTIEEVCEKVVNAMHKH